MTTTVYLAGAAKGTYKASAIQLLSKESSNIKDIAVILNISAAAIGGALAEENNAYGIGDKLLDFYADNGIPTTYALKALLTYNPIDADDSLVQILLDILTESSHDKWLDDYNYAESFSGIPGKMDKLLHPALIDIGPGNFKIQTAISMLIKYANQYPALGLKKLSDGLFSVRQRFDSG